MFKVGLTDLFKGKKCDNCGTQKDVKRVIITSFSGPRRACLCPKCLQMEKMKVY